MTNYVWRPGARVRIDAQVAGEELSRIEMAHNGRLDRKDVLDAARAPSSPLHPAFDWNDAEAAESWRLQQASMMIASITTVVEKDGVISAPVRAFVSVMRDDDRSYINVAHALSEEDLRRQVLGRAVRELRAWRDRYDELVELADIFSAVDQARLDLLPSRDE